MSKISICFASGSDYGKYMGLALMSVLKNSDKEDTFHFYILDNGIKQEDKNKINTLQKIKSFEIDYIPLGKFLDGLHVTATGLTVTTFAKFASPKLINEDKLIYLDCDIFVRKSLTPLWNVDISDYYIAGALDLAVKKSYLLKKFKGQSLPGNYINAGVLLINNKKWKEENIADSLLKYAAENSKHLKYSDQDCLNHILYPKTLKVSPTWNMRNYSYDPYLVNKQPNKQEIIEAQKDPTIRHFKPWKPNNISEFRDEYIEMMKTSPWAEFTPKDDLSFINLLKILFKYWKRYPACFFTPKFYIRIKHKGFKNTICGVIE